jgi:hypothetical protein
MSPFDQDPNDDRSELDLCLEEIFRLKTEVAKLNIILYHRENGCNHPDYTLEIALSKLAEAEVNLAAEEAANRRLKAAYDYEFAHAEKAEAEVERLKEGWKQAEQDKNSFFSQSCINLARAEKAEAIKTCGGSGEVWKCEKCGLIFYSIDEMDSMGSDSGTCCRDCGCEQLKTIPCLNCNAGEKQNGI